MAPTHTFEVTELTVRYAIVVALRALACRARAVRSSISKLARLTLLLAVTRCGGSTASTPPGITYPQPLPPATSDAADVTFLAIANGNAEAIVEASFALVTAGGNACTKTLVAGCSATTCTTSTTPVSVIALDPGSLTATSPTFGDHVAITLVNGVGRVVVEKGWPAGEQVGLEAIGGADFPGFDATVTIPPDLTDVTIDGCTSTVATAPCALSASGPIVTWQGGADTFVIVDLSPTLDTATTHSLSCQFSGDQGVGQIPAEALATLDPAATYSATLATHDPSVTAIHGTHFTVAMAAERVLVAPPIVLKSPG
jgi:hypothetical protein